jgi:hypothetical protein
MSNSMPISGTRKVTVACTFPLPLNLPVSMALRTADSIYRCEVMPTFLRNFLICKLNVSSFIAVS